jgi:mono/diheme cytochrome c family protein
MTVSVMRGRLYRSLLGLCLAAPLWGVQDSAPVIPGLGERHPLDEASVGRLLLDELRCAACHSGIAPTVVPAPGPDLSDVGWRVAPDYLQRFITDPAGTQHGTKMPGMLDSLRPAERADVGLAITHFLVDAASRTWAGAEVDEHGAGPGDELFHSVGCVACHAPRSAASDGTAAPAASGGAVDLAHVPAKYGVESLAEFLFQPTLVRTAGRMPDMGLTRAEARDVASYLVGSDAPKSSPLNVRPELVGAGRDYFEQFSCSACHALEGLAGKPPVSFAGGMNLQRGCLAASVTNAPQFHLSTSQRAAIASALEAPVADPSDADLLAQTLTAFNCIACHARDDYGGVRPGIDSYFETDEHDLGNDARIPPPLTLAGGKLQRNWMAKVLFESGNVRPYMFTRMPQFGESNLAHLPDLFEREDLGRIEPYDMPLPEGDQQKVAREGGRELVGTGGLSCISCHDFNGTPSPVHEGVDLINSCERLRPSWFARFLIDPQTYRPGVVMPESWPGGVAAHTEILDGDTDAQVKAIWYYLSQGRTARDPEGIHPTSNRLAVTDTVRTYRGRSQVAGFRGIAVGHPVGLNFAFNAQTGTQSALWRGDFVSVRWNSQGAGGFDPSAKEVRLAQDVSFYRLPELDTPWPLRPHMDDENPINPDPLYPRNKGYRFGGYFFDERSIPTFLYTSGDVAIEDRSETHPVGGRPVLHRTLSFSAPAAERLFFRALTGEFTQLSARQFETPKLRLTISDVPILVRDSEADGPASELLLELNLPAGASSLTIDYELLD